MSSELQQTLIQFRNALYSLFPKRKDAVMNLLDSVTAHGRQCQSVIELSNTHSFERQYSSITDAIADGLTKVDWKPIEKLVYQQVAKDTAEQIKIPTRFILDCTPNPRPYATTLKDRHITHCPNPAPGNKPICVGHQYSVLTLLPNDAAAQKKQWTLPLSAQRVRSSEKGNEVGMHKLSESINELGLTDELCIGLADSLYGTVNCRKIASEHVNLVHIFRLNTKRNVFFKPTQGDNGYPKGKGRKKEFGDKISLTELSTDKPCDEEAQTNWTTAQNKQYSVTIKCWKDMLLRGSRTFRSSEHPLNLIQVTVTDEAGQAVFKRPLWLAVFGRRRHEITVLETYDYYKSRYGIEHLFRFSKRNLLLDKYQTPEVDNEELWWRLCFLGYIQLYLSRNISPKLPNPWEKYLPEYKEAEKSDESPDKETGSPSQTQRGFEMLLKMIGTPAKPCVARGKSSGRTQGEVQMRRQRHPIIFKTKKAAADEEKGDLKNVSKETEKKREQTEDKVILSGSESEGVFTKPEKIEDLLTMIDSSLKILGINQEALLNQLTNSS